MFVKLNELIDPINTWNSTREMGQVQQETPPKGIVTYVSNAHMPFVTNNSSLFHSTHEYLLYKILKIKVHKSNSQIYHPNTIIVNNSEYFLSDCFLCMGRVLSVCLSKLCLYENLDNAKKWFCTLFYSVLYYFT